MLYFMYLKYSLIVIDLEHTYKKTIPFIMLQAILYNLNNLKANYRSNLALNDL